MNNQYYRIGLGNEWGSHSIKYEQSRGGLYAQARFDIDVVDPAPRYKQTVNIVRFGWR